MNSIILQYKERNNAIIFIFYLSSYIHNDRKSEQRNETEIEIQNKKKIKQQIK